MDYKRKSNLRKQFFKDTKKAQCQVCGVIDHISLFDLDHLIPKAEGGPDEPWNLWSLCLKHHRIKSIIEKNFLPSQEKRCYSCGKIYSRFFQIHPFWCASCHTNLNKFQNLQNRIQFLIFQYEILVAS